MDDVFTRRGFAKAAGVGLAALFVPSLVRADELLTLTPRWHLDAETERPELRVTLFLRGPAGRAVELPANAVRVFAHVQFGSARPEVELVSEGLAFQRRSRAGFRLGQRMSIPAGAEVPYDNFFGGWPNTPPGQLVIHLRTEILDMASRQEADQPALTALAALTGQVAATRTE